MVNMDKKTMATFVLVPAALASLYYTFSFLNKDDGGSPEGGGQAEYRAEEPVEENYQQQDQGPGPGPEPIVSHGSGDGSEGTAEPDLSTKTIAWDSQGEGEQESIIKRIDDIMTKIMKQRNELPRNNTVRAEDENTAAEAAARPDAKTSEDGLGREKKTPKNPIESLKVRGILLGEDRSSVLADGYILKEGDLLPGGYRVIKIDRKSIVLKKEGEENEIVKLIEPRSSNSGGGTGDNSDAGASEAPVEATEEAK